MTPELKSGMIIRTQDNNLHLILGNTAIILGIATGERLLTHTNSELIWQYEEPEQFEYPLYRKLSVGDKHIVVQFTDLREGMVMESNVERFPVGYTSTTWRPHTDKAWEEVQIISEPEEDLPLEDLFKAMGISVFILEH